jgi:signal peptidase II
MSLLNRHRLLALLLAGAIYWIDQQLKAYVFLTQRLQGQGPEEIVSFFRLYFTENYGVSFGMFTAQSAEMRWMLVGLTSVIALGVLVWIFRERKWPDIFALGLVFGGALSNIRDRFGRGYVVDYADLHFGEFRPFLIFNLADAAITIGVLIILARSLLSREKPETAVAPAPES